MTCEGFEWYEHQGVSVREWPPLENCISIDADACKELQALFHLMGADEPMDLTLMDEPKPWPFPTGKVPEKEPEPEKPASHFTFTPGYARKVFDIVNAVREASAIQEQGPKTQPSGTAKSPLNGLLTVSQGLHRGIGFCDGE